MADTQKTVNIQEAKRLMYSCKHHKEKKNPSSNSTLAKYECKILYLDCGTCMFKFRSNCTITLENGCG